MALPLGLIDVLSPDLTSASIPLETFRV